MAKIIDMAHARRKIRDQMAEEMRHGDNDETDVEADKLLLSFANALDEAPLTQEEKLLVLYMKLIETLMSLDYDRDRNRYTQIFEKHFRDNIIEADRSDNQRELSDDLSTVRKEADDELGDLTDDEWFP